MRREILRRCLAVSVALLLGPACSDAPGPGPAGGTPDRPGDASLIRTTAPWRLRGVPAEHGALAWFGVPYARPPVGDLRWRAPREPEPWQGVRSAETFGSFCPQYGNYISETGRETLGELWGDGTLAGEEDCLYLNLWRPGTPETGLPVYVFVHGGANFIGRSDLSIYDGARFSAVAHALVVTVNYRLGYLGWFAHPALREGDPLDDSGNYATLDLIMALAWIRDNIAAFGGDPGNVTLSGQSAGAINAYSLLCSPLAGGLFHRAVLHSGLPWSCPMESADRKGALVLQRLLVQEGLARTLQEAEALASGKDDAWVREFLRSRRLTDLFPPENGGPTGLGMDMLMNIPALMGVYEDGTVLPESCRECLEDGSFARMPVVLGNTSEEMKLFLPLFLADADDMWDAIQAYDPDRPSFDLGEFIARPLWPVLWVYEPLASLGSVLFQDYGVDRSADLLSRHQREVYAYKFLWDEEPDPFDFFMGAAHAMDLPFWFGNFVTDPHSLTCFAWSRQNRAGREALSRAMTAYLARFARTGDPGQGDGGAALPAWTPWARDPDRPERLVLDTGGIVLSSERREPQEAPCPSCTLEQILDLLQGASRARPPYGR